MAEEGTLSLAQTEDYPSPAVPRVYVDGMSNIFPGLQIFKMNFSRFDQSMLDVSQYRMYTSLQMVMPTDSFIQTAQFMTNIVDGLVKQGVLTKEKVEEIRKTAGGTIDPV